MALSASQPGKRSFDLKVHEIKAVLTDSGHPHGVLTAAAPFQRPGSLGPSRQRGPSSPVRPRAQPYPVLAAAWPVLPGRRPRSAVRRVSEETRQASRCARRPSERTSWHTQCLVMARPAAKQHTLTHHVAVQRHEPRTAMSISGSTNVAVAVAEAGAGTPNPVAAGKPAACNTPGGFWGSMSSTDVTNSATQRCAAAGDCKSADKPGHSHSNRVQPMAASRRAFSDVINLATLQNTFSTMFAVSALPARRAASKVAGVCSPAIRAHVCVNSEPDTAECVACICAINIFITCGRYGVNTVRGANATANQK